MTGQIRHYAKDEAGFSFAELMVVIALIGILSAIALPSLLGGMPEKRLKNTARNLYSDLQKARLQAVKENRNITVTFNTAGGTYSYTEKDAVRTADLTDHGEVSYGLGSVSGDICTWNIDNSSVCEQAAAIAFTNTGTATAGSVYLQNKNKNACYAVNVTSFGAISIKRFNGSSWE